MSVCQISYKTTSTDTVLLEDQFVLHWPIAEEDEHHPVLFWGGEHCCSLFIGEQWWCASMMLYLPAFMLHLLSNSPSIFMLIAEVISGNGREASNLFGHFPFMYKGYLFQVSRDIPKTF